MHSNRKKTLNTARLPFSFYLLQGCPTNLRLLRVQERPATLARYVILKCLLFYIGENFMVYRSFVWSEPDNVFQNVLIACKKYLPKPM